MNSVEDVERARMLHFRSLEHEQQAQAIHRLALAGQSEQTIVSATGLSVEMIRRVLSVRRSELNEPTRENQR